jgi:hypothetical protein
MFNCKKFSARTIIMQSFTAAKGGGVQKTVQPIGKFLEQKHRQGHHGNLPAGSAHCAQQFTKLGEYCCEEGIPPAGCVCVSSTSATESFCPTNPLLL